MASKLLHLFLSVYASGLLLGSSFHSVYSAPGGSQRFTHPVPVTLRTRQGSGDNDGIHLAVSPQCGPLDGKTTNVNAGIVPTSIKTIVSFGDSYTDGGVDNGSALLPPVLIPPNDEAGGRSTNGPVWIEGVSGDWGAHLMDYAQWGACTNLSLWPSNPRKVDFIDQMATFLGQSNQLDPDTTLYSIFFGINDYIASLIDGDQMPEAAQTILNEIQTLSSPPTNGKSFLVVDVYGRGNTSAWGEAYKQQVFDGLKAFHEGSAKLNVAYVDMAAIWDGVLGPNPGYQAFGYTSTAACTVCTEDCNQYGWCMDPEHYFYWIDGHPSKETHRIMADWVEEVLQSCKA
ncbi:carbohydrate esterase family 16 protein [Lentinula edodes]|uniref:carbohydrate esterase family 16 protein n=1 Tax=Lentinula edodes TaxID=5353 RepID=UPI001BF5436B|nr:carbohydrate esterase family 16 protein [Lentinula edodes]KAF8829563.1 hypothetical protein HHX47_DHR3000513 [Lentinula edodes]KAH7870000.1 carbohydrate esterase family 16 protein [Lentinula edodes]